MDTVKNLVSEPEYRIPDSPKVSVTGLYHTSFRIDDIQKALDLYCGILGCKCLRVIQEPPTEMLFLGLPDGNTVIAIRYRNRKPILHGSNERGDENGEHTAFKVATIEAYDRMLGQLAEYGLKPFHSLDRRPPAVKPGREAYFEDPNGRHIFEIRAPLPGSDH
ncbi:hypothetical protein A2671_01820 [Candidatus Kaiserbacteria bacterium RIFCSPHIGHO2_01_FULL_49_13]|uniref:Glyoxalase/fosfomycin resistance/dioxygenase domain-containing protein n=1 Tax=Candidatus Kaiserbacteria bacterium RIFCSPHIGHO2_01_FULL_49_13 TaxID=1798477 RepID=A0A1F6CEH7_9BACT|nr:MAG: hypothetical protein A2671_01820 [Candidatus Kaiserbacteria bacterium RIFCSPHIGHO2_01_FULL_49_13]